MSERFFYVTQYDAWWRLSRDEWLTVCRKGADGYGHDLTPYRRLKNPPRHYRWLNNVRKPLDWYPEDYQEELDDLNE